MPDSLSALVREKWLPLLDSGFEIRHEDGHRVALQSQSVEVVVVHDPRGEVDVYVFPCGGDERYGWSYTGMVGTAPVGRLLEIALARMRAESEILCGDAAFYERLAEGPGRVLAPGQSSPPGADHDLVNASSHRPGPSPNNPLMPR